jgi:hypothetical protein
MRRASMLAFAALLGALLAAPTVESAGQPRFTVSIEGTQRFEWTINGGRDARGLPTPCAYKGSGQQVITFRTARPVSVLVPKGEGTTYTYGGQPFLPVATRKRLIPLVGQESRQYRALEAPAAGTCAAGAPSEGETPKYYRDCRGTNPFLPNAGVVVMRYRRPTGVKPDVLARAGWKLGERHKAMMYAPVDVLLFDRRPKECDLLLFDLRNYLISQLVTVGEYRPLTGGDFERRATRVVQSVGFARGCVDPFGSDESMADLQSCGKPRRPGPVTGEITANWKITFRRAR